MRWPSVESYSTAWRWLNVPRSTSSPVSRIGVPSARIAGERQLLGRRPVDRRARRIVERLAAPIADALELAMHVKAFGHVEQRVVERAQPIERHGGLRRCAAVPGAAIIGRRFDEVLLRVQRFELCCSSSMPRRQHRVGVARPAATPRDSSVFAHCSRTVGCAATFWYITGCVNAGSSPSLCP